MQPRLAEAQQSVVDPSTISYGAQHAQQAGVALDGLPPNRQDHVSGLDTSQSCRRIRRHGSGDQSIGALTPEHAVLDATAIGADNRVGDRQTQQDRDDTDREQGPAPLAPIATGIDLALVELHEEYQVR